MNKNGLKAKIITVAMAVAFAAAPVLGCGAAPRTAQDVTNAVGNAANNVAGAVSTAADTAASAAVSAINSAANTAADAVGNAASTAADAAASAVNTVTSAAAGAADSLNAKNLPGFAPIADGFSLTDFEALTTDGGTFTQENFADKDITAINFWATTCPPCVAEMPELAEFQKSLPSNLAFVTACLDAGYAPDAMKKILDDAGYTGINLIDYSGDIAEVADAIQSIPTTVFVNSDGVFVGGMVIGGGGDFAARFTDAFNAILTDMGKETI